jgi:hypothetical protein
MVMTALPAEDDSGRPDETAVERVARIVGGYGALARICDVDRSRPHHWRRPRRSGGCDGSIPGFYHSQILRWCRAHDVAIEPGDLVNV